jgi:hypothetical protein
MKGNSEPGTSLDVLEKKLKAEGWVLVNKPDRREDLEVATLLDPVTRKPLNRPATIRFSWVVAVAAVDIAPDKKHEEVYHLSSSPSQDLFFKGIDGETDTFTVNDRHLTRTTEKDATVKIAITMEARKDLGLKLVLAQQRIEVIEPGKVTQVGFLNHHAFLEFRQQPAK